MLSTSNRRRGAVLASALVVVAALAIGAAAAPRHGTHRTTPARTTALACGAVITKSVTLAASLTNCPGIGLKVAGKDVIVNLNKKTVAGKSGVSGIEIDGTGVTVENGSVTGFFLGISSGGATAKIQNMRIWGNTGGAFLAGARDLITGSTVYSNTSDGIDLGVHAAGSQATNNYVRDNTLGIQSEGSLNATIEGNKVVGNSGIGIAADGNGDRVVGNVVDSNGGDGIFTNNNFVTLTRNVTAFNTKLGINVSGGDADGGGNKGIDNGTPQQCKVIVCS
jgi:Right handed beta helix region